MRIRSYPFVAIAIAILLSGLALSASSAVADDNLLSNASLKAGSGGLPSEWKTISDPGCGSRFILHNSADAPGELEIVNEEPVESSVEQTVELKPGWYHFSAEMNVQELGSSGADPELFVRSTLLRAIKNTAHQIGWQSGWQKVSLFFKAGTKVKEVVVGCSIGNWGSPNTGRILFRNPTLLPVAAPPHLEASSTGEVKDSRDLDELAEKYSGRLGAGSNPSPPASYAFLGKPWTVVAAYLGLLAIVIVGWLGVSHPRSLKSGTNGP